jgi:hypothetical protein
MEKNIQIDVLISSCARIDILEESILSFKENIHSKHNFRYVLIEDNVENKTRQGMGKKWIDENSSLFDQVHYLEEKAGPGVFWLEALKRCESDYHFHLEDDNKFLTKVNIDPIIDVLQKNKDIVEVVLGRGKIPGSQKPKKELINGVKLTEIDFFSMATGVYNTRLVKRIIDELGWDKRPHELGTLTPKSRELGFRKFILGHSSSFIGHKIDHYAHLSKMHGYAKGSWRKI